MLNSETIPFLNVSRDLEFRIKLLVKITACECISMYSSRPVATTFS